MHLYYLWMSNSLLEFVLVSASICHKGVTPLHSSRQATHGSFEPYM